MDTLTCIWFSIVSVLDEHAGAITTVATIVIAAFTIALASSTKRLWREAKISSRIALRSAQAANTSAKAVMLAERAYVKMSHRPPGLQFREHDVWIEITIKNFGRTPARVTDLVVQSRCLLQNEVMPDKPEYNRPKELIASRSFLVADEELSFAYSPNESIDVDVLKNGTATFCVFGYVDYTDIFNVRHRAGYGRQYRPEYDVKNNFGGSDEEFLKRSNLLYMLQSGYNYDRRREKGEGNDW